MSGASRVRIKAWAVARVSGRGRWGLITVSVSSFSRCGHRRAATLVATATASGFCVFTTIDDRAAAVAVSEERPVGRDVVSQRPANSHLSGQTGSTTRVLPAPPPIGYFMSKDSIPQGKIFNIHPSPNQDLVNIKTYMLPFVRIN